MLLFAVLSQKDYEPWILGSPYASFVLLIHVSAADAAHNGIRALLVSGLNTF